MKPLLFIAFILAANIYYAQNTYKGIEGRVTDKKDGEAIVQATITAKSGECIYRTVTDIEGNFSFQYLPEAKYTLNFTYDETELFYPDSIQIDKQSSNIYFANAQMLLIDFSWVCPIIIWYRPPENPTINYKEIQQSVNKYQLTNVIQGISSNTIGNEASELSLNGAQEGNYLFLIDGIKCRELHQLPSASMKSVTVMSHFIPAKYGDTTGGVILIETISYMDLYNERERRLGF